MQCMIWIVFQTGETGPPLSLSQSNLDELIEHLSGFGAPKSVSYSDASLSFISSNTNQQEKLVFKWTENCKRIDLDSNYT